MGAFPFVRALGALVSADDTWILWAIIVVFAAVSIYCEQNYKWGERLSGPVIGLILAVLAVNLRIIPSSAATYDTIWSYCIPLSVVMLLFRADLKKIFKETGTLMICFIIAAVGTIIGAVVAFFALRGVIPELSKMAGILTGSYIGGGVNLFAVASSVDVSDTMLSAEVVADNFVMALAFFLLLWIPSSAFFKKHYPHPYQEEVERRGNAGEGKTMAASFWQRKEISLIDLAVTLAVTFVVAAASAKIAAFFKAAFSTFILQQILGNQFVILTLLTVALATAFPKFFANLRGAQEVGTFLIYMFFVVIGCPADLGAVIKTAPLLFVFCAIIAAVNIGLLLGLGKIFKLNIEELTIASNASLGGPSTAAAMAVAKGYDSLIIPAILVGLFGYIIGTPLGLAIHNMLA
ncbi:MAG: DUF819 family protein [Clostridiaceae bacterium]|nr:DUF819 family protein [Clostridiaceae bacterium]